MEVIFIGYIFKPKKAQVDVVARAVEELKRAGLEEMTVSKFYDISVEGALEAYRTMKA